MRKKSGCELLSKVYIFDIRNNNTRGNLKGISVVNCFQKFISLIFETTLRDAGVQYIRCELLSKVYIFDIRNNLINEFGTTPGVVNCFQKFISLIFETTISLFQQAYIQL